VGSSLFARSIAVEPVGGGQYRGELSETWNCPIVPQGGIVSALAARAMTDELAHPEQTLRSISVVFAGPVAAGPCVADVTVLRRGRSMSQLMARVHNPDAEAGLTAIAVFGADREGFEFTDNVPPPGILPPMECPSFRDIPPEEGFEDRVPFNFWENVEGKPVIGHAPWEDYDPVTSLVAKWSRFDDPPRADDGTWDPLAVVALSDTMPSAAFERIGPDARDRPVFPPSADFTVHLFGDARCEWLLHVNRARRAWDGYASVDMETWDMEGPEPHLVAYATQVMFFSFQ
jgi:acyl-CoA thioesterase